MKINCKVEDSCNRVKVYCGDFDPPGSTYSATDMDASGKVCNVDCHVTGACNEGFLSCKGSDITKCRMSQEMVYSITDSTVECNSNECELNCDWGGCVNSELLCHSGSTCDCWWGCNGVTTTNSATYEPTFATAPITSSPTTSAPTTQQPTTTEPTTSNPTSSLPTTANPTSDAPSTSNPTSASPSTSNPTTFAPSTGNPTTNAPSTSNPTSKAPTTASPSTENPTTFQPTPKDPTTANPTSSQPTTVAPTTAIPTTSSPTTSSSDTMNPTTAKPTSPNLAANIGSKTTTKDGSVADQTSSNAAPATGEQNGGGTILDTMTMIYIAVGVSVLLFGCVLCCMWRYFRNKASKPSQIEKVRSVDSIITNNTPMQTNGEGDNHAVTIMRDSVQHSPVKDGQLTEGTGNMDVINLDESDDGFGDMYSGTTGLPTPGNNIENGAETIGNAGKMETGMDEESGEDMYDNNDDDDIVMTPGDIPRKVTKGVDNGVAIAMSYDNENEDSDDEMNGMYNDNLRFQTSGNEM